MFVICLCFLDIEVFCVRICAVPVDLCIKMWRVIHELCDQQVRGACSTFAPKATGSSHGVRNRSRNINEEALVDSFSGNPKTETITDNVLWPNEEKHLKKLIKHITLIPICFVIHFWFDFLQPLINTWKLTQMISSIIHLEKHNITQCLHPSSNTKIKTLRSRIP